FSRDWSSDVCSSDLVRATSGEPWPGQREWNDHDYRQFVELMSQGAFPEVENDSCVWDDFFVRDRESDTPFRPTLISPDDYRDHTSEERRVGKEGGRS